MDSSLRIPPRLFELTIFFALCFLISWGLWIPASLAAAGMMQFPFPAVLAGLLGAWAPSLAGLLMTALGQGRAGLRVLLGRLRIGRVAPSWYLFVLFWPAVLSLATTAISRMLGSPAPDFAHPPVLAQYPLPPEALAAIPGGAGFLVLLPVVLLTQILGSSLGEELGWRGFALPRLQAEHSPLASGVALGFAWGIWHMPRLAAPGQPFDGPAFAWFLVGIILASILYTWIYNHTRGSLLLAVLFHTSLPVTSLFLAQVKNPPVETLLTLVAVGMLIGLTGSRAHHPAPAAGHA